MKHYIIITLIFYLFLFLSVANAFWWKKASTWDEKSGRYISTEEFEKRYKVKDPCTTATCYDEKSGRFLGHTEYNERLIKRSK